MWKIVKDPRFLGVYAGTLTVGFVAIGLMAARKPATNAEFDQITVHRINVVEPDGTTRMVIADQAEFPGAFFRGKEYPRADRESTGMLFNNDEGTENGGLIFGGKLAKDGTKESYGHLSFDEYERDQTLVAESDTEGGTRNAYYAVNDDDRPYSLTPEFSGSWQKISAMPAGPERAAATKAWQAKYPGGIVQRAYVGRGRDGAVSVKLDDAEGHERLVLKVSPGGSPEIDFLDGGGRVVRSIGPQ